MKLFELLGHKKHFALRPLSPPKSKGFVKPHKPAHVINPVNPLKQHIARAKTHF